MGLNANKSKNTGGKKFPNMEAGTYPTRLVHVVDMGLQPQQPYKGEPKEPAYMVLFTYEFVDEFMPDDDGQPDESKPRFLSEVMPIYPLDSERAKSTKRYGAFDPKGEHNGDFGACVNTPLVTTVVLNPGKGDRVYENIASVAPMRAKDAAKCPELVNDPVVFDQDQPDLEAFMKLPRWVQNKIKDGLEYEGSELHGMLKNADDNEPQKEDAPQDEGEEDERPY